MSDIPALTQPVSMIMTTGDLVTVDSEDDVAVVRAIFAEGHINHIPVLSDARRLVGVVASADLLQLESKLESSSARVTVGEIMTRNIETVDATTEVRRVAELLSLGTFHSVLVTDTSGELLGIVTSGDVLRAVLA